MLFNGKSQSGTQKLSQGQKPHGSRFTRMHPRRVFPNTTMFRFGNDRMTFCRAAEPLPGKSGQKTLLLLTGFSL
jgi:hypothetical protein